MATILQDSQSMMMDFRGFPFPGPTYESDFSTSQQILRMQSNWSIYITRQVFF